MEQFYFYLFCDFEILYELSETFNQTADFNDTFCDQTYILAVIHNGKILCTKWNEQKKNM